MEKQSTRVDTAVNELVAILGERLSTVPSVCAQHGQDESFHTPHSPDAVAFVSSTEEVVKVVKVCATHSVPIIPFGTGTSLEGHVAALSGGICVDLTGMNEVLSINAADLDATVQAGVTRRQLNENLRYEGLFFPIDPGADASIGGMAATRASGTNAVRYGTMRENVLALRAVMPDGRVIKTARRARKSSAGYDLTRLLVGSEGTLGIITEVTLRLYGVPESVTCAVCSFPTLQAAVDTVILTIQSGIPIARIELLDDVMIDATNRFSKLDNALAPTLFLEFHGTRTGTEEQAEMVQQIAYDHKGGGFRWASHAEDRNRLWRARHDAAYAAKALRPGCQMWPTDVCVPISRLAECISATKDDVDESFLMAPIVGHVGDGNFHLTLLVDPDCPKEIAEANRINERLIDRALLMDGTCTGEHGVGYGKVDFLVAEHGEGVNIMQAVKSAIDPQNIMNPGKVVRV